MKVKLEFQSPLIVGGRKLVTNYIESLNYIQGNVIRAAFARYILNNCSEFRDDETVVVDGKEYKNWVYYRDKEGCKECKLKSICQKFSKIKFSYFYPEGIEIIPLTAMICKNDEKHGFIDCLIQDKECPKCKKGYGRVEHITGYIKNNEIYDVKKIVLTRTEINRYTQTSKDGKLYSIVAVLETSKGRNVFEGCIEGLDEQELSLIKELRVGKYLSVGYGKCILKLEKDKNNKKVDILGKLKQFDKKYKGFNKDVDNKYNYFAIKLVSDAKVKFNQTQFRYLTTDEYKSLWEKALNIDESFDIYKVYAEIFNFRGYDTSKVEDDKREDAVHMIEKGSVILFRTTKTFEEIYEYFSKLNGLGEENENGFGDFIFYFGGVKE
ncbi:RAMP superfamily CRISPR-associated protein [Caloranaerobacter sp. DY30410]|uniref:RAMP superfamily CRISPR-associated protein n=1 Tax=Caloranaerobacter sp. DY30410 TaxID=3238305 RepID=UPI003CFEA69E